MPNPNHIKYTPHQRIMRAANKNTHLRLSRDEVQRLAQDDAIMTVAANDDADMEAGNDNNDGGDNNA